MSIDITITDHVAVITINRPERHNALDAEHYEALSEAWVRVRDDQDIRCAVVTGAGEKSFSTGADLKTWIGRRADACEMWLTQRNPLLNRGLEVWKPVIAAVNGYCLGGGMTLLLATDIRIAVDHAEFGVPEVCRGVIPANGGTQRLLAQLPHAVGMEMLLTGRRFGAETAARWGLVNEVVSAGRLLDTALEHARRIAANAPLAVQAAKELATRSCDLDLAAGMRMEQFVNRILQGTEDVKEGRLAFAEKRVPKFRGE
ncbi:enoyl-CoA hydratase/isomerase family protein [Alcaligenaceae bacterium]|nr:enoyl-CoA hydratase/isomerase family protein [Alcaligenaceae bacterium]